MVLPRRAASSRLSSTSRTICSVLRLIENLMPYLGVSQRTVVAKRLQGTGTDAQLLADFLIVHSAVELPFFPFAEDFIHPVRQAVEFVDHFLILFFRDNYYIHFIY